MGNGYLTKPVTTKYSEHAKNDKLRYAVSCMQGWRKEQEDAHNCILDLDKDISFFAIYDGHSNCDVAVYCSLELPKFIQQTAEYKSKDYKQALTSGFLKFDASLTKPKAQEKLRSLWDYNKTKYSQDKDKDKKKKSKKIYDEDPPDAKYTPGMESGCVAVVAIITEDCIYTANIGDSRCIVSKGGTALTLSIDHKPEDRDEEDRIQKAGGFISDDGRIQGTINISRAFGDLWFKGNKSLSDVQQMMIALPDVFECPITPDIEFMVLACDGIWNCMSNQEVIDFVKSRLNKGTELSKICEQLFDSCVASDPWMNNQNGSDNMTCIIVQFLHRNNKKGTTKTG